MSQIITNTQFQKNPGALKTSVKKKGTILTIHGVPEMLVVPYFEGSDEWLEEYMEAYEIAQHQQKLQEELSASKASGESAFSL